MQQGASILHAFEYLQTLQAWWWPFCRIMAVFALAPIFSHKAIPARLRILLGLALTVPLGVALPCPPAIDPLSAQRLLVALE